jgi:hypothetical protein
MAKLNPWTRAGWRRVRLALRRLGRELGRSLERMGQTGGFMTPEPHAAAAPTKGRRGGNLGGQAC